MSNQKVNPRIAFIDQYKEIGGGQQVLIALVKSAELMGFDTVVFAPPGGQLESRLVKETKAQFHTISEPQAPTGEKSIGTSLKVLFKSLSLVKYLDNLNGTQLIVVNGPRYFPLLLLLSPFLKTKIILYIHLELTAKQKALVVALAAKKCVKSVISVSSFIEEGLKDAGLKKEKSLCIPNSLGSFFENLPFRHFASPPTFGFLGRLSKDKGFDEYLKLANDFPQYQFHCMGDIDFGDATEAKQLLKQKPTNVTMAGKVADVPAYVFNNKINVGIVPSRSKESFGLAALEWTAMSCLTAVRESGNLTALAAELNLMGYDDYIELKDYVQSLETLSISEIDKKVQNSYDKTKRLYSFKSFHESLSHKIWNHL